MRIVLFARVPKWYSFRNDRLATRLTRDGHQVVGVVVQKSPIVGSLIEWKQKLGREVFLKKIKAKLFEKGAMTAGATSPPISTDVYYVDAHNSPECEQILRTLDPDLIILRGCGIIKKRILDVPRIGVINPHYAKLPDFRGMDVTEWTVLCGEPVGVSVHTVNEGVDTGVVLKYDRIRVSDFDTTGSLRDKSAARVVELLAETATELAEGREFPSGNWDNDSGKQYFVMHERLRAIANRKLRQRGPGEENGRQR